MDEFEFKARFVARWMRRAEIDASAAFEAFKDRFDMTKDNPEELADVEMDLRDEDG